MKNNVLWAMLIALVSAFLAPAPAWAAPIPSGIIIPHLCKERHVTVEIVWVVVSPTKPFGEFVDSFGSLVLERGKAPKLDWKNGRIQITASTIGGFYVSIPQGVTIKELHINVEHDNATPTDQGYFFEISGGKFKEEKNQIVCKKNKK